MRITTTTVAPCQQGEATKVFSNLLTIGRVAVNLLELQLLCVLQIPLDRVQHALHHRDQILEGTTNFAA